MDPACEHSFIVEMLEPFMASLTPETAEPIARMKANPVVQARVDELAGKSTEGELTEAERSEYESYVKLGNILGILKARARKTLLENSVS